MVHPKMIDMTNSEISDALRDNRAITREKCDESLFVMGDCVVSNDMELVNVAEFYQTVDSRFMELIESARNIRSQNVWNRETHQQMTRLDGGCMYLLAVLQGHSQNGEVFSTSQLQAELEEVLSDEEYAIDLFKEYDECASPLGMGEWYGYHSTIPMIRFA